MSEPKVILIVDDEPTICELAKTLLEQEGHRVLITGTGQTAIEFLVDGERPDLALIDVRLPGMKGQNLQRVLVRMMPGLKTAFFTGSTDELPGETETLYKPFLPEQLLALVKRLLADPVEPS